ncbi:MAG: hydrogenase maturation nickel metallochaperone HypA [Blautia sp.]|nr:hydrogenase maturation nickel metallochaperone HypA [Blautia sp.]
MHELSVVFYIIEQVEEVAQQNEVDRVTRVILDLGEVSTVIPSYLTDCWKWARNKHPLLTDCELTIEPIEAVTYCEACRKTYPTIRHGRICPWCGSPRTFLKQGNEFLIREMEVE